MRVLAIVAGLDILDNIDLPMSQKQLLCCQCGEPATVFTLQFPLKLQACSQHTAALREKHAPVLDISAFDLIESPEDCSEYVWRRDVVLKCQGALSVLRERCECNRAEACSRLQTAKEALQLVVERSFQELQTQVELRYQHINEELTTLKVD